MELVSIGRNCVEIPLFDTKGGKVKLWTSLTGEQQTQLLEKHDMLKKDIRSQTEAAIETIVMCFVEWNIGKDGTMLECTPETVKQFTQRDILAMLQACTGKQLLDENGNMLDLDDVQKKGMSA